MDVHPRPFDRPGSLERVAPFAGAAILALGVTSFPPYGNAALIAVAAMIMASLFLMVALTPWWKLPAGAQGFAPFVYFVVIALLRHAEGGSQSGFSALVLLPVLWIALHGTRTEMWLALACMGLILVAPILAFGEPAYPVSEWRRALIWLATAPLVGLTAQRLVEASRQEALNRALEARTDVLTALPNRRAWDEALSRELARVRRSNSGLCVAVFDIDHFKRYNDVHGHQAGDDLLRRAADAWRSRTRGSDLLARYGGEEFAMLLPDASIRDAVITCERVRTATPDDVTASVGIAQWDGTESGRALVERADEALYRAKRLGRDRIEVASGSLGGSGLIASGER